jgi:hypothetical protein
MIPQGSPLHPDLLLGASALEILSEACWSGCNGLTVHAQKYGTILQYPFNFTSTVRSPNLILCRFRSLRTLKASAEGQHRTELLTLLTLLTLSCCLNHWSHPCRRIGSMLSVPGCIQRLSKAHWLFGTEIIVLWIEWCGTVGWFQRRTNHLDQARILYMYEYNYNIL